MRNNRLAKHDSRFLTFSEWVDINYENKQLINESWSSWWDKYKLKIINAGIFAALGATGFAVSPFTNEYSVKNLGRRALYEKLSRLLNDKWILTRTPADFLAALPLPIRMAIGGVIGAGIGYIYAPLNEPEVKEPDKEKINNAIAKKENIK
jgi:hypothetical protein